MMMITRDWSDLCNAKTVFRLNATGPLPEGVADHPTEPVGPSTLAEMMDSIRRAERRALEHHCSGCRCHEPPPA